MGRISLLASANGIELDEKFAAKGNGIDKVIDSVCLEFEKKYIIIKNHVAVSRNRRGKRLSISEHFKVIGTVLSCLYYEWSHSTYGNHRCVRYYRRRSGYTGSNLSFLITLRVIDWLIEYDYIEHSRGYYYASDVKNQMSRIRPKSKLAYQFGKISRPSFTFDSDIGIINIRDSEKTNGIDPSSISEVMDSLFSYGSNVSDLEKQRQLNRVRINHDFEMGKKVFVVFPLYRVFNNSTFGEGGRFYGSAEQYSSKSSRKKIYIDRQPTIERDYKNLHIKMLYDLVGIQLTSDSYTIHFKDGENYKRSFIKKCVMMLINSPTQEKARKAIQNELNHHDYDKGYKSNRIIKDIKDKHQSISRYFGSGKGLKLQNIDSEIALEVMYHFAKKDIPCLCIHDSFIVDKSYQNELDEVMKGKYCEVMRFNKFRMETTGKNQTRGNIHWNTYLRQTPDKLFCIDVD